MGAVWRIAFYGLVILVFAYLLFPILVVIPSLSPRANI